MTGFPAWYHDEIRQVGLDFEDAAQVEAYDRNQGSDGERDRALVDRLGITKDHTLIDFGAGTGSFALEAARTCKFVHAVDVSRAMLAYARRKGEAAGLQNIAFHHGGFLTYAHGAEAADVIVTRFALHHLPDFWKMAALLRLAAMLRDGGVLYLQDVVFSFEPSDYRSGIEAWIERVARPDGEGFTKANFEAHVREEYSTYGWILEGMFARAGFRVEDADTADPAYAEYLCSKVAR